MLSWDTSYANEKNELLLSVDFLGVSSSRRADPLFTPMIIQQRFDTLTFHYINAELSSACLLLQVTQNALLPIYRHKKTFQCLTSNLLRVLKYWLHFSCMQNRTTISLISLSGKEPHFFSFQYRQTLLLFGMISLIFIEEVKVFCHLVGSAISLLFCHFHLLCKILI